jgi:hypothetical protein
MMPVQVLMGLWGFKGAMVIVEVSEKGVVAWMRLRLIKSSATTFFMHDSFRLHQLHPIGHRLFTSQMELLRAEEDSRSW